ncbi:MAG: LamG domain-containing protein, partial [Gammaproteobacteria bacterium]
MARPEALSANSPHQGVPLVGDAPRSPVQVWRAVRRPLLVIFLILVLAPSATLHAQPAAANNRAPAISGTSNQVLVLDGSEESYVQLPPDILRGLNEVTVEGWVRWDEFREHSRFFFFGEGDFRLSVYNHITSGDLRAALDFGKDATSEYRIKGTQASSALAGGKWIHIAVVIDSKEMRLYLNGTLSATEPGAVLSLLKGHSENRLGAGRSGKTGSVRSLHGAMDEVRVWKVARSAEQISENILKQLTGNEPGLVGLWNFDDPANPGRDASPNHHDGKLVGGARVVAAPGDNAPAGSSEKVLAVTISGMLTDGAGKPLRGVEVQLLQGAQKIASAKSGTDGSYFLIATANEQS